MSKLLQYMRDNNSPADNYYENQGQEEEQQESSSGSFFDGAKKWLGEYINAVSEGRPMWKSEATIKPVDWGTAGGNGSMPTTFSNSTYENMQNPETTLSDVGNAIADRISEITPQPIKDAFTPQVIAPNWQPRPLDDSVYSDTPGTPTADGQFGALEDENERQKRMNEAAQWAADNMPRSYSAMLGAVSGAANVAGGIRNALGGENSDWILRNAEKSDEAMNKFRQQWENQYGDSGYLLNPNGLANDIGNSIGSSVPIMALSLLAPEAAVGVGTRAITSALTRAGLGRLAGSKAGQALIEEVVRSPLSTTGDTMAEYGTVVDDLVQSGMSEDEAREKAKSIIPRNVALDTLTIPGELYVMKGAKGLGRKFQAASTDSIGKRIEKGMARAGLMSAANAIPEGYQEGAQNALEDNVKGERDTGWYNPFSWNEDDLKAARGGAVGGAIMGIPGNVAKGMQTYSNTGNAGIDATVDAANEYNIDPKALLSIGARESGGDDITAIGSASQNAFQIEDETAENYGVDKMYPDWKTDLKQNAEAAAFILTKKIEENGGDVWAGVAGYNGGGDPDYLAKVQNTYNSIPDDYVSGGGSGIQPYNLPTQGADIDEQVSNLTPEFQSALPTIGGILNEMGLADGAAISSAARTTEHNAEVGGAENSYHVHNDAVDIVLPEGTTQEQADAVAERFRNTGAFKEVLFHDAGSGYHLHLGGYNGGLNGRGGAGGTVESTYKGDGGAAYMEEQREADRQYQQEQRDRDNAYQQEINNIMNDNTSETIANDVDKEMKDAKAQQEEGMKALTPEQQKEEISDYLDSVSQDDISDEDFNALWDATQSNDQKQIQTAYQTVQDAKKAQTAKPIKTEDTPVLKSVQKQKQPTQQGTISTENTSANQTEPNTQTVQDNKQTQPLEQTVQPPLNTAPNGNPIHTQQGAMNNETTQSTQSTNNQNVNTKSEQNQRENAETVQAQKGTENQGTTGIIENVRTDNAKQNIPAQYKLVSADDVISSDMPAYPQQYQPRNRNRLGMVAQVEDMSNQLNPSAVVDQTGNVNMGAPVINSKGVVLNGNGRTMAIRKAYSKDNKSAQAYKQYLKDNAEKLGLDPTVVDKIKNPMIVRQVADDAPIEDIIHSTAGGSRMSASEQAKSDAKKISTSTLDKYKKENPPDLSAPSNRAFVKSILDDITTDADRNAMYTESGQITKEAIRRVQDALFARAYGDDSLLNRMTESTDDNIRIVSKVMLQCAPKIAKLKEGQEHGDFYSEYDVSNVITQAAKDLIEARDAGKPISYKTRENDMFETSKRKDDEAIKITLKFFDDNKRKPRRIQEYVNSLADYVIGMGSPKFETESNPLFDGGDRMTMDELANFAEGEINGGRNSNLHVEGERTNTETKSVPQTVQEESGTAGNGSAQESNGTEVVTQNHKTEVKKSKEALKTESEPERTSPDEIDLRTISIEDAEREAMEALGIKPHKKPVLPKPNKGTQKPKKKTAIKDDETLTLHIVDQSDEALAEALKVFDEEASKLNANPMFNPRLMTAAMKIGAIHLQRGANKFIDWLKAMSRTDSRLKSYAPAVWKALQVFPKNGTLNEKQMTSLIQFVGVMYHHGITDKTDLRKRFIAALGVKNARYFDTAYTAIVEYPTAEELKGDSANVNDSTSRLATRTSEGNNQNAVGANDEGRRPGSGNGQNISQIGKGQEQHKLGDTGIHADSTTTSGTTSNSRVQTKESNDNTSSTGSTKLSGSVRDSLTRVPSDEEKRPGELSTSVTDGRVNEGNNEQVTNAHEDKRIASIRKEVPILKPEQAGDVAFAERRLIDNDKNGVLFTNGTGTGKTFSGLGIIKRMYDKGKKNIIVVTPNTNIIKQWTDAAKEHFGIEMTPLESVKDGGKGVCITTFANFGYNHELAKKDWDLVVCDESQNLMSGENARPTNALRTLRAITHHEEGFERWLRDNHSELWDELQKAREIDEKEKTEESKKKHNEIYKKWNNVELKAKEDYQGLKKSKVVFLSATPFAYVPNIDYANGYLFDYGGDKNTGGYNQPDGKQQFFINHFGYKMRYNRLERPDAEVDSGIMEREFHNWLEKQGALSGRQLVIDKDYDRGFIRIDGGIGNIIDEGREYISKKYPELAYYYQQERKEQSNFDKYLLEAIKAKTAVKLAKKYIEQGKKVVIFHDFKVGGAHHPFKREEHTMDSQTLEEYRRLEADRPDLINLDLRDLKSPIERFKEAFGDDGTLAIFNGDVSKKNREKAQKDFNDDNGKAKIILVQSDAGQAGISLHDTTGKYQRVLINLGMPTKPTASIQIEGRIYRTGNKSNAIIRYLNTGTNIEQNAFATRIAERASTAENLALGDKARALKKAFIDGFEESQDSDEWEKYLPGSPTEGTGGKEKDRANDDAEHGEWDKAKAKYFANQKKTGSNKSAEGVDYYATPEPLGLKMVEWSQPKANQSMLEPSAGHGAIAQWFPSNTKNTVVEPSNNLVPKLQMHVDNANVVNNYFENIGTWNKFDRIVMNPPFGKGGKTAVEHLAKAYKHLREGGRIVAIIPDGPACQKHFDKWFWEDGKGTNRNGKEVTTEAPSKTGVIREEIALPSVTFERAGTKVNTKIVIIDKFPSKEAAKNYNDMTINVDMRDYSNIKDFFNALENKTVPDVLTDTENNEKQADEQKKVKDAPVETRTEEATSVKTETPKEQKTGKLSDDEIEALTNKGFNRWTKGDMDRLYIKPTYLGLDLEYYKSGNISSATFNGESISNSEARRLNATKCYVDIATRKVVCDNEELKQAAQEVLDSVLGNSKYSVRDNSKEIQRSMQEVKDEIKSALPTAKDITEDGNTLTFTLPNGSKIVVDVQNQIALTAEQLSQAKKDHNINGNVVVEGYAQKYGKDAYIALSQGSRKGTGYHEVYHVAEDTVLNDKEKAALRKKYPNEEMRADKYAEWVEARKHGKGTLFGKLFRKIQDFAKKMQAILTRTENVHNVFRKIESGEVWNRKAEKSEAANAKLAKAARQKLQEDMQAFSKSVDDFMNGKLPPKDVKVMTTPLVMNLIGEKLLPIYIHTNVMEKILKGKHSGEMSAGIVKKIPKELTDPLMILKAINNQGVESNNQKIVVIDLKNNYGATIMVPFIMDVKANRYELSNVIESAYGRGNKRPNDKWYIKRLKRGDAVYANKKRIDHWLKTLSLAEAHNGLLVVDSFNLSTIIPDETDLGKLKRENPTKYSIRKTQDAPLNPKEREQEQRKEDILKAINEIVPVYTKSDVKKNAVTETYYDRRQKAGFVKTPTIREYGRILALNLDQQLKLKNNMELTTNVKQELEKNQSYAALMGDKIKDMTPVQARAEGVSIFGSLYFNGNEEAAAARFPKYYEAFKNALKENKELNDKVNHITEMIGDYKAQNPVLRANSGMQMHDESQKKTTKGKIKAILDNVYAEMVDELDPLTKITKLAEKEAQQKLLYKYDVHKQALMAQGNAQSKASLLLNSGKDKEEAIHALNDKDMFDGAIQYKVNMNDIMDAIKNVPQEELEKIGVDDARQGLAKYLIAMRTEELSNALDNEYVRPDGFDEEACHTIIKDAPESIKTAAKMVWDFNKNMINIMQQQGLINKKAADTMRKYAHYVPMYHDMSDMQDIDDFIGAVGKGGRGFVDIKPNIYEIKGGNERAIIDPIESMVRMTVTLLNKCQRNKVGQALARINQDFEGMGSIIAKDPTLKHEDPKKCAFSVYVGGKKVIYRTTPEVYTILTDVDETGASVLESVLKPFASALRRGATISPSFIVRNFTRDTITAGITSQTGFIPFVDSARGMYKLMTDKQFKMDYLASGASMGTFIRSDVHGSKDLLKEISGNKYSSLPKGLKQIAKFISAVWNLYDHFGNLVEDSTRAGEFMRARKKGIGLEEAGYLAKEVTLNFGRHGKAGKHANRIIPFFNATIQGTDKFIRAFKKNPARASFMTAVTIILPSIIAWALANGSDDDWYQDLDANTKYTNWCFKIGDSHILIPKPQEAGILFGSGVEAVLNQMMGKDPQAMKQWAKQHVATLLPNIVPTLAAPIVEWMFNYSMWKGRNLVPESLRKNEPSEYQYNSYTSEIAKALGDTTLAKEIKLSPIAIDNFISGYFGSAGRFIANMLNSPVDYLRDSSRPVEPAKYWYEMPFVGSFVRRNHENSEYQNRFYNLASDMTDDYNRMKHDNPKAKPPKGYKEMETAKKTVSKLNKEISEIKSDTKMGPEQKLQQIELRQNKIRHFTKKFVTQYGK